MHFCNVYDIDFISLSFLFFFTCTPRTPIYPLSLHDALPISPAGSDGCIRRRAARRGSGSSASRSPFHRSPPGSRLGRSRRTLASMTPTDESFTADTAAGADTAADVAVDPAAAHSSGCPEERATVILLVRHGATATTGSVLPGRAPGLHLAAAGRDQARRVGERLLERHAREPIRALYSSPLERAHETAEASAQALGLPVQIEPSLL